MKKWENNQLKAINHSDGFMVVSASAGSGKTSVIVERIFRLINSEKIDIDKLLIVTFTVSAAEEIKNRILDRILEELNENPFNKNLLRQKFLLNFAQIGTIDSFCNQILKENFEKLNISPNFRIADEKEMLLIEETAMNLTLEKIYSKEIKNNLDIINKKTEIIETIEFLIDEKNDDKLIEIILKLYKFNNNFIDDGFFFENNKKNYQEIINLKSENLEDFLNTNIGRFLKKILNENLDVVIVLLEICANLSANDENIKKAYLEKLNFDLENIKKIKFNLKKDFLYFSFSRLNPAKSVNEHLKQKIIFSRGEAKKIFNDLLEYFSFFEQKKEDLRKISSIIGNIFNFFKIFKEELKKIKQSKNIIDFNDLECFSLKILQNNGKPSKTAAELSERFEEIIVDEYQDVNHLQDRIFNLISKNKKNLFIVGDVKQSIYSFRRSTPEIFINYLNVCEKKIILSENFRSKNKILQEINYIFQNLMTKKTSMIDYKHNHEISSCINNYDIDNFYFKINIIDLTNADEIEDKNAVEAEFISEFIRNSMRKEFIYEDNKKRKITYNDFCILLRNANKKIKSHLDILNKNSIPVKSYALDNFFENEEIRIIVSLLKIINNPLDNMEITYLLTCPLFGFSLEEILKIRQEHNEDFIYFEIKKESFKNKDEIEKKCKLFLDKIDHYREKSFVLFLEELIEYIIDDSLLFAFCYSKPNSNEKILNIEKFSVLAKEFQDTTKCLSSFVDYIQNLKDKKIKINLNKEDLNLDYVKIISIHKSKGLEFPICILAGCSNEFLSDYDEVIMDSKIGMGIKLKNENGTVKFQNIIRKICEKKLNQEKISEEIRLLYVALTRAKENLTIMITEKDLKRKIENIIKYYVIYKECENKLIEDFYFKNCKSFSDWILYLIIKKTDSDNYENFIKKVSLDKNIKILSYKEVNIFENNSKNIEKYEMLEENINFSDYFSEKMKKRFDFIYKNSEEKIPLKISASKLASKNNWQDFASVFPSFINDKFSQTEIGIAIHTLLSISNFDILLKNYDYHLKLLFSEKKISERQFKILVQELNKLRIKKFLIGELGQRLMQSKKIFREYQFSILENFDKNNKPTMIQGEIDCVFQENNEFIIIDYKTDKIFHIDELLNKYANQLQIYKKAFEKCEKTKVNELIIYSFHLNSFINIDKKYQNF
ncbi:MAG: helicase-exonuclease AddAB subunit AddA [Candidatus Improbicoccus pseudotrichonymphae]|uniref:DNA 3'-5' helicase n=1 Tax=Candidatus Improbicoccus pseudotrichonymphae TaxID=3033792 RepID=A0AA48KYC0_9FIRM|nr:MAG: helicase-exonuclease AddAB subunit AddA [Candidatus Improbicoccus pseudotrichonymphae]